MPHLDKADIVRRISAHVKRNVPGRLSGQDADTDITLAVVSTILHDREFGARTCGTNTDVAVSKNAYLFIISKGADVITRKRVT